MELNVVFGSGPVGLHTAKYLLEQGKSVRIVNRSGTLSNDKKLILGNYKPTRLELKKADALQKQDIMDMAEGASCIFHCINPLYHQWKDQLPIIQEYMISAALNNNAVLALSENLYMYRRGVKTISEDTAIDPPTKKGEIRQYIHEMLIKASEEHGLRWTTIRASDFYGPGSTGQSMFGTDRFLDQLYKGKKISFIGNPDTIHTYTYVADFGKALALAAHNKKAWGHAWVVANKEHTSTRALAHIFMEISGKTAPVGKLPDVAIKLAGLFNPVIREIPEMLYQKNEPYQVDGSIFSNTFEFSPTPVRESVRQTLDWYNTIR